MHPVPQSQFFRRRFGQRWQVESPRKVVGLTQNNLSERPVMNSADHFYIGTGVADLKPNGEAKTVSRLLPCPDHLLATMNIDADRFLAVDMLARLNGRPQVFRMQEGWSGNQYGIDFL